MVLTLIAQLYAKEGKEVEEKLRIKLNEASEVFVKDEGTLSWFVMQDQKDPRMWCIVERYEQPSSLKTHVANPYFKTFGAFVGPLLAKPMDLRRFAEISAKL